MPKPKVILRLFLALTLLLGGLPAHACMDASEAADPAPSEVETPVDHDRCPHHPPPSAEDESTDITEELEHDCCGMFCRCGCSAPVPGLMLLGAANASPENAPTLPTASALDPSLSPEQLLRPPKPLS